MQFIISIPDDDWEDFKTEHAIEYEFSGHDDDIIRSLFFVGRVDIRRRVAVARLESACDNFPCSALENTCQTCPDA